MKRLTGFGILLLIFLAACTTTPAESHGHTATNQYTSTAHSYVYANT